MCPFQRVHDQRKSSSLQLGGRISDMSEREVNSERRRRMYDQSTVKKKLFRFASHMRRQINMRYEYCSERGNLQDEGKYVRLHDPIPLFLSQHLSGVKQAC